MATTAKTDIQSTAEAIHDEFPPDDAPSLEAVSERLQSLVQEYRVPIDEAEHATRNYFLTEAGLEFRDLDRGGDQDGGAAAAAAADPADLVAIDRGDQWLDEVIATVVELWEPRHDSIGQIGLLGDASGTIKFVKWAKSALPELEEDQAYRFENVVTDEYEGRYSVNLNSATEIEPIAEDIEVGDNTRAIDGALVSIQSGSGLVKRCPEDDCGRVIQSGRCVDHGEVDGEFDLRTKAVIDDGATLHQVVFDADATEELTGISLADAKERAKDALDTAVVVRDLEADALGHYYHVEGPIVGEYLLVEEIAPPEPNPGRDDLLDRVEAIDPASIEVDQVADHSAEAS